MHADGSDTEIMHLIAIRSFVKRFASPKQRQSTNALFLLFSEKKK